MTLELTGKPQTSGVTRGSAAAGPISTELDAQLRKIKEGIRSPAVSNFAAGLVAGGGRSTEDRLFDRTAELKVLISQISMHISHELRTKLFRQIDSLHDPEDWLPSDVAIEPSSFRTFLRFLLYFRTIGKPSLGISYLGQLLVGWTDDRGTLAIQCLPNDEIAWTVAHKIEGRHESAAGRTSIHRADVVLRPYDPAHWIGIS